MGLDQKLGNTQQRVRRISTKASVWASSASQSNIWKQFLSCDNKNTQRPRFQAQHIDIKPRCPLWSAQREEAYTKIRLGLNVSTHRVHSMTTQLAESPTSARWQVLWGHSQIPQITPPLPSDYPLAWKQFCGRRWREEGVSQKTYVLKWSVSVLSKCYDNFICMSNCVCSWKQFSDAGVQSGRTREDSAARLLFIGSVWKAGSSSERYHLSIFSMPHMLKFGEPGETFKLWTNLLEMCSF